MTPKELQGIKILAQEILGAMVGREHGEDKPFSWVLGEEMPLSAQELERDCKVDCGDAWRDHAEPEMIRKIDLYRKAPEILGLLNTLVNGEIRGRLSDIELLGMLHELIIMETSMYRGNSAFDSAVDVALNSVGDEDIHRTASLQDSADEYDERARLMLKMWSQLNMLSDILQPPLDVERQMNIRLSPKQRDDIMNAHRGPLDIEQDAMPLGELAKQLAAQGLEIDKMLGAGIQSAVFSLKGMPGVALKLYNTEYSPLCKVLDHPTVCQPVAVRTFEVGGRSLDVGIFPNVLVADRDDDAGLSKQGLSHHKGMIASLLDASGLLQHWQDHGSKGEVGVLRNKNGKTMTHSAFPNIPVSLLIDTGATTSDEPAQKAEIPPIMDVHPSKIPKYFEGLIKAQREAIKQVMGQINEKTEQSFDWSAWDVPYSRVMDTKINASQWLLRPPGGEVILEP